MVSRHQALEAQEVRFARADDGVRLAWARHGSGPPLLIVSCWLSHLQHDWESPVWRHFLDDLGDVATVVRYDERGFGLSEWDVDDFSLERRLADLETLVEATGLDRFAVLGMSGGAPVALAYAHKHPERVTRMVLYGGMSCGRGTVAPDDEAAEEAFLAMIRAGWARPGQHLPPRLHHGVHPRRHRAADGVDGRAPAHLHQHRQRRAQPDRPPPDRRDARAARRSRRRPWFCTRVATGSPPTPVPRSPPRSRTPGW